MCVCVCVCVCVSKQGDGHVIWLLKLLLGHYIGMLFSGTGMVVMAIPIFTSSETGKSAGDSVADRTEYYTTAKNLLTSGADAMERLMTAYKVQIISQKNITAVNHC